MRWFAFFAFFAVPAWALDSAPSVQPQNWLQYIIGLAFTAIAAAAGNAWNKYIEAKTHGTLFEGAVSAVGTLVETRLTWAKAELVKAAADGVVTKEEMDAIARELLGDLSAQTMAVLTKQLGGGVVSWVGGLIKGGLEAKGEANQQADKVVATVQTTQSQIDFIKTTRESAIADAAAQLKGSIP